MAISTYAELLTELDAWLNRSDLTDRIPTFVRLFEARMNRNLRVPEMEAISTITTSADLTDYSLPSDFLAARTLYIDDDPDIIVEAMSPSSLRLYIAERFGGIPQAYAVVGQKLVIGPVPDDAYIIALNYYQRIPALTDTETTNWLLDTHPDAYLWGTLCMANAFLGDDPRLNLWKAAWDEAINEITASANKQRLPAGPLTLRSPVRE